MAEPAATWWLDPAMVGGYRYLRCEVPARHLPGVLEEGPVFDPRRQRGDAAIFRSLVKSEAELVGMREAKRLGVRVVLDVEDNHLAGREDVPEALQMSGGGVAATMQSVFSPAVPSKDDEDRILSEKERLHMGAVELADALVTASEATAAVYRGVHPAVTAVPNAVDPDAWPPLEKPNDGVFRIGVFASPSHACDLELVGGPLRWASQQPAVEVIVFGVNPRGQLTWREWREQQRIFRKEAPVIKHLEPGTIGWGGNDGWEPYAMHWLKQTQARQASWSFPFRLLPATRNYAEYLRAMVQLDVGLCPLVEDPWSRCRADSKPLEYAMCGVVPLCSDAEPYRGWRWPLVADAQGFVDTLAWCLAHRDEVREHELGWRETVATERSIVETIEAWADGSGSNETL